MSQLHAWRTRLPAGLEEEDYEGVQDDLRFVQELRELFAEGPGSMTGQVRAAGGTRTETHGPRTLKPLPTTS